MIAFIWLGLILLIVMCVVLAVINRKNDDAVFAFSMAGTVGAVLAFFMLLFAGDAVHGYAKNKAYVANADRLIAVRTEELSKLDAQIAEAKTATPNVLHLNADTPVASIIAARLSVAKSLSQIRERKILTENKIITAETGVWWPIIAMAK